MATGHRVLAHLTAVVLLVPILLLEPLAAAQPQVCGYSGNYTRNSTYQSNLRQLSATLTADASASPTLFTTGSVGSVPDMVFALALCRGDINASACEACVSTAFQDAQQLCPFDKDASVFYDLCLLHFSNQNFLPATGGRGNQFFFQPDSRNVSGPATVFDHAVCLLLNATADHAVCHGRGEIRRRRHLRDLRPGAVYAGFGTGRLPELPRGYNSADARISQRGAEREGLLDPVQLSVRALSFFLRQPSSAASGAGVCWNPAVATASHTVAGERWTADE